MTISGGERHRPETGSFPANVPKNFHRPFRERREQQRGLHRGPGKRVDNPISFRWCDGQVALRGAGQHDLQPQEQGPVPVEKI